MQDRKSKTKPKGRNRKGGGNDILRSRSISNHAVQGTHHIQPISNTRTERRGCTDVSVARRCKWQELDSWVSLPHRPLPLLVRLAGLASSGAQEVPGSPLCHLLYVFLWPHSVCHYCCSCWERPTGLDLPQRWRGLQHLVRGKTLYSLKRLLN